jgi:hypothetical protein
MSSRISSATISSTSRISNSTATASITGDSVVGAIACVNCCHLATERFVADGDAQFAYHPGAAPDYWQQDPRHHWHRTEHDRRYW